MISKLGSQASFESGRLVNFMLTLLSFIYFSYELKASNSTERIIEWVKTVQKLNENILRNKITIPKIMILGIVIYLIIVNSSDNQYISI